MKISKRVLGILAVVALVGAAVSYVMWLKHELRTAERARDEYRFEAGQLRATLLRAEERARKAAENRKLYLDEVRAHEETTRKLRDATATNTKQLRIKADCPDVPGAKPNPPGATAGTARLTEEARRAYFDLRTGIVEMTTLYNLCRRELENR